MIEKKRIQIRRDLEQNWIEINPILLYGEIGFDLTNNKIKIGDGERPWNELSWVNETTIDLSNYYTKEEIDEIVSNIEVGGGGSDTNANIVDIMALSYEEQLEIINFVINNNTFPDINTLYTYHGYILNNLEHYSEWWDESLGQKYIGFTYYARPKTYQIRFITSEGENGKIYNDIIELDESEKLVTKKEVDEIVSNIEGGGGSVDLSNYYTKEETNTEIQNAIDSIEIPTTDLSNYYTKEQTYSKEQVDEIVSNIEVGGGGSDTNANIVDIMSLTYEEQLEIINYVIDNNTFPDINTLYTYHGYILNNLKHYSEWWDESEGTKYIIFDLYAHPKSYDIRFITYQWNEGKIYNDINEKDETKILVTKEQVDDLIANSGSSVDLSNYYTKEETNTEIQNAIDSIEIPEQQEVSNATITIIQGDNNQSFNLNQSENQTITIGNKDFNWFGSEKFFNSLPDEQKVNGIYYISDKINYKEDITGQPYIVYKTSQLLNDKPFATTNDIPKEWFGTQEEFDSLETYETNTTYYIEINGSGGGESGDNVDLSNYYTKDEIGTILNDYYTKEEIDNIVGLINNELEIIING